MVQSCYLIWPCPGYVVTFVRSWSVSWVTSSLALAINACNISICWFGLSSFDMMRWKRKDIWKKPLVYSFQHSNRHLLKDIVSLYIWRLIFLVKKKKKSIFWTKLHSSKSMNEYYILSANLFDFMNLVLYFFFYNMWSLKAPAQETRQEE